MLKGITMSLRIWGSIGNIEYISFNEKYREQSMNVREETDLISESFS